MPVQVRFTCAPAGTLLVTSRVTVVAEPAGENASLSVGSGRVARPPVHCQIASAPVPASWSSRLMRAVADQACESRSEYERPFSTE